jgi:hypothetical protein
MAIFFGSVFFIKAKKDIRVIVGSKKGKLD